LFFFNCLLSCFIPVIDLQGDQDSDHDKYDLANRISEIFSRLLPPNEIESDFSEEFHLGVSRWLKLLSTQGSLAFFCSSRSMHLARHTILLAVVCS
jgi:hypothetical protein